MKTCPRHGPACQSRACNMHKPHLRLQCQPHPLYGMVWRMVYVRGPSQRSRRASFWHGSAQGAVWSAIALWFASRYRR